MSSPVFNAKTSHTKSKPQLCGLSGTQISKGDNVFYLTCRGKEAKPDQQVLIARYVEKTWRGKTKLKPVYEGPGNLPWRSVPSGNYRTIGEGSHFERRVPIFKWQEERNGVWHDVRTWENMVLADVAVEMSYQLPRTRTGKIRRTVAKKGDRTKGYAHDVGKPENPLLALARLAPEEGEVSDE